MRQLLHGDPRFLYHGQKENQLLAGKFPAGLLSQYLHGG